MDHEPDRLEDDAFDAPTDDAFDAPTGDAVVDEALAVLDGLEHRSLPEHVAAFESVHGALQDRLAEGQR